MRTFVGSLRAACRWGKLRPSIAPRFAGLLCRALKRGLRKRDLDATLTIHRIPSDPARRTGADALNTVPAIDTFTLRRGHAPLLISLPHDSSFIPDAIAARMRPPARRSPDTDWHVGRLYEPLAQRLGASVLRPRASRYVIDLNRPADGHALYPGQRETGLVPLIGFDGEPLYLAADQVDAQEVQQRTNDYWRPYHQALADELARLHAVHGCVVLWDGHSIRSRVPMLFKGRLPDFNLGTAAGASCGAALQARLEACLAAQTRFSVAVNGRFKGGYITRHYGVPASGVQAVQLELAQRHYMDEESFIYDEAKASAVQDLIDKLLRICLAQASHETR